MLNQLQISALDLRLSIMAGVLAVMALVFHALGSVLGALIIQFLESGLLLLDVGIGMRMVIIGQVLIAAVVFDVLILHDMPDVFGLSDRLSVMKNGKTVGSYRTSEVTEDEVLGMIIAGKKVARVAECIGPQP